MPAEPTGSPEREKRQQVRLPASARLVDGAVFDVTILDLTYDGCKIETNVALLQGLELHLSIPSFGELNSEVRWYREGHAGLQFRHAESEPGETALPPREERLPIIAEVGLRRMGRANYHTRAFNLSPSGCKVEFVERPKIGEQMWAKFDGMDSVAAEVRWVDGFYGGLEFMRAIHPSVFELLLKRLG